MWFLVKLSTPFKKHLDKFWSDQEVFYNYKMDLHGIRNCSILVQYFAFTGVLFYSCHTDKEAF